ncbi:MAG TPA: hypothetical protein VJY62_15905 [Bacteroidia bacterium]|nr:hypothetical protein [Bacteroidia bacterium]
MNDTSIEIRKKQSELWFLLTEEERLIEGLKMMDESKILLQIGILNEHPEISEAELNEETFRRMYRNDFSEKEMYAIFESFKNYQTKNAKR